MKEENDISITFDDITPTLIYTPDNPKSKRHLAVCFVAERDDLEEIKLRIDPNKLILNRSTSKSGSFQNVDSFSYEPQLLRNILA